MSRWRTWPVTECSAHCGHGKQTMGVQCVQQFHDSNIDDNTVHNSSCSHLHKPAEVMDCEGPCNSTHWEFGIWSQVGEITNYLSVMCFNIIFNIKGLIFPDIHTTFLN